MARVGREVLPAVCPVCKRVPKPSGMPACEACLDTLRDLPSPRCPACGGGIDGVLEVCSECLRQPRRPWSRAVSSWPFAGAARYVVHRFKYQGETFLAPTMARAMVMNWQVHGQGAPDVVVPIPLHWTRYVLRGYNQVALLAELVAKELHLPWCRGLVRQRATAQQAMLDLEARQRNLAHGFRGIPRRVRGNHVLLLDDVMTTGATLAAATAALNDAGASAVSVLTVARG